MSPRSTPGEPDCPQEDSPSPWGRPQGGRQWTATAGSLRDPKPVTLTSAHSIQDVQEGKQPQCPSANTWINEMSTSLQWGLIKRLSCHITTWINLSDTLLSKMVAQRQLLRHTRCLEWSHSQKRSGRGLLEAEGRGEGDVSTEQCECAHHYSTV